MSHTVGVTASLLRHPKGELLLKDESTTVRGGEGAGCTWSRLSLRRPAVTAEQMERTDLICNQIVESLSTYLMEMAQQLSLLGLFFHRPFFVCHLFNATLLPISFEPSHNHDNCSNLSTVFSFQGLSSFA